MKVIAPTGKYLDNSKARGKKALAIILPEMPFGFNANANSDSNKHDHKWCIWWNLDHRVDLKGAVQCLVEVVWQSEFTKLQSWCLTSGNVVIYCAKVSCEMHLKIPSSTNEWR